MTAQKKNSYEDSDFQQILDEIEGFEDDKVTIRAKSAGECSAIAKKIEAAKKTGVNLGIPKSTLTATLKTRKLERKLKDIIEGVNDDEVELFEDAIGQFSLFKPTKSEKGKTGTQIAASRATAEAKKNQQAEQVEGAAVLDDAVSGPKVH